MENLISRIEYVVAESRNTTTRFAKNIGVAPSNFFKMLKGELTITKKTISKICNTYGVSYDWLLKGEGDVMDPEWQEKPPSPSSQYPLVPVFSLDARGGYLDNVEQGEEFIEKYIPWQGAQDGDFAIAVSGTSMMPNILPGAYVLLRKVDGWRQFIEYNTLYVLELEDSRRLLKLVQKSADKESITLISYNPENPPQDIKLSFVRRIFKVVGTMTNYGF